VELPTGIVYRTLSSVSLQAIVAGSMDRMPYASATSMIEQIVYWKNARLYCYSIRTNLSVVGCGTSG
jgi:hypothetical protein